jgi:Xaa-Pro aminopeptidase
MDIEAIWVSQPDNIYYLTGCEGLEGYMLVTQGKAIIVTDFRYVEQAERQSPDCNIFRISGKMSDWLPEIFAESGIRRLGFESSHISFAAYKQMADIIRKDLPSMSLITVENMVESLRMIKDPTEIGFITQAVQITDAVITHIEKILQPGMTEKTLAWEIEKFMRENGSQPVPFEVIVAAGPHAALPHAKPSDHAIQPGEPIVIDIGARRHYYSSDMTRTLCIGEQDETFKKVYDTVLNAQQTAIASIKPGMTGREADAIARQVIIQAGYGEAFGHSLGHGIGLITHENPRLSSVSSDILTDGMVFTIEPGIYLRGWGGVRIEDDVAIENGKIRVLSSARK